jgi:hypothetical protein
MKRVLAVFVAVLLGLWAGYSLGYHHGTRRERSAWLASEEVMFNPKDGQINAVWQALVSTPEGPRKFVEPSKRPSRIAYYADPHSGKTFIAGVGHAVNTPDPRNTPVK